MQCALFDKIKSKTHSEILLKGSRWSKISVRSVLGSLVGVLLGATRVGAPPVVLYLLSGPDPVAVTRANLTLFVTAISVIGLIMLTAVGAITAELGFSALALSAVFLLATWFGGKLFVRLNETNVRRFALVLMLGVSVFSITH